MVKQLIVKMQEYYPFGQCQYSNEPDTKIIVQSNKKLNYAMQGQQIVGKVAHLRKLDHQCLIKVDHVVQEPESISINYQYIPIKLSAWISNINQEFIDEYQNSMIKFASFLANNGIGIEFEIENMGLNHDYSPKYFIGIHYTNQPDTNRKKLKSYYIKQISNIFKPYQKSSKSKKNALKSLSSYQSQQNQNQKAVNFTDNPWKNKASQNQIDHSNSKLINNQTKQRSPEKVTNSPSYIESLLNRIRQNKQKIDVQNRVAGTEKHSQNLFQEKNKNSQEGNNETFKMLVKRDGLIRLSSSKQKQIEQKIFAKPGATDNPVVTVEKPATKQTRIQQIANKLNQLKNMVFGANKPTQSNPINAQHNQNEFGNLDSSHFAQVLSNIAPQLEDMDADDGLLKEFMDVLEDPETGCKIFQFNSQKNEEQNDLIDVAEPPIIKRDKYSQTDEIVWSAQDDIKSRVSKAIENSQKAIGKIKQPK